MTKGIIKYRGWVLILGICLLSLFTISVVIDKDLKEDYIGFQLFRTHLKINRFMFMTDIPSNLSSNLPPGIETTLDSFQGPPKDHIDTNLHELDLSFYIFKESLIFSLYRDINRSYDRSFSSLEGQWELFTTIYLTGDNLQSEYLRDTLSNILISVEEVNTSLVSLEEVWSIYYSIVLSLVLLVYIMLLIKVFLLNKDQNIPGQNGIMSVRNALIEGQEQERLRISLELHDKVAQDLFAARMTINDIPSISEDESILPPIIKCLSFLDSSIKEVRDLSYSLRPPALQAIGLDSAIQSYIDNFSKKIETPITFKAVGVSNKNIDEKVSINLYRILQETLNNTAKHAHSQNIDIKLIYTYPYLLLKIEDDGVGFKYTKSETKVKGRNKLGLPGIYERVTLLGGELIINTDKGEGTKILIKVPVARDEKV